MLEFVVSQSTDEEFIITVLSGGYEGVVVKVVDLKFNESGEIDFEIELPTNKVELFKDEVFKEEIAQIVGELVKKSVSAIYKTQEDMAILEESVATILKNHRVPYDHELLLLEQFMSKGFLLKLEEEEDKKKILAIDVKENKTYDLEEESDFEYVRRKVFQNIILH
jgi:hypothetical protein